MFSSDDLINFLDLLFRFLQMIYIWATLLIMQSLSGLPYPHFSLNHGSQISCGHHSCLDIHLPCSNFSLQWFIQKVQDRILQSTLRSLVIKDANKSRWDCLALMLLNWDIFSISLHFLGQCRYSLEYLDKDETIVAHMAGGTDAYIKLSHGWPIFGSPLKLICIKGSDDLKRASLSFHCKVEVREFQSILATKLLPSFFLVVYGYFRRVSMWYQGFKLKLFLLNCLLNLLKSHISLVLDVFLVSFDN